VVVVVAVVVVVVSREAGGNFLVLKMKYALIVGDCMPYTPVIILCIDDAKIKLTFFEGDNRSPLRIEVSFMLEASHMWEWCTFLSVPTLA
jgi:hypothetical protein